MPDDDVNEFLYRTNLAERGNTAVWSELAGGVSSDIWRVEISGTVICVKRALPQLRVASLWQAPIDRNDYEWKWFCFVFENFPQMVPRPLAHDAYMKMLAMEFLDPQQFRVWKSDLLAGIADPVFSGQVGRALAQIHSKSAGREDVQASFATDDLYFALRIEPYLLATAERHPELASRIRSIAVQTQETKIALVHGDVSPKNIMIGPSGPVFLDAETAWFGDPAFDVAFCLNHLLLKSIYMPRSAAGYLQCFKELKDGYLAGVTWEQPADLDARAAALLPALLLARVDGKSPVEYLVSDQEKETVRSRAYRILAKTGITLSAVAETWPVSN